ncbi:MAG: hypothetical protein M3R70_04180 [Actinomycetota bacterium]|nr:hypothetical protein [Actinomycetota bacterium]
MKTRRLERLAPVLKQLGPAVPPILLAVYPVVSLFQHNQTEIAPTVFWKAIAVAAAIGAGLFVLLRLVIKRCARAGVVAALVVLAFFYYGIFAAHVSGLSNWALFPLWVAFFVAAALLALRAQSDLSNLSLILTAFAATIVLIPGVKTVTYRINHAPVSTSDARLWPSPLQKPTLADGAPRPDVYFIIPDDYARGDVLKRYFHYDNSKFFRQLQRRGFVIADQSRSPYSKSEFNMASALNLDYLSRLTKIMGKSSQDVLLVRRMIGDNRASHVLKDLGYRYIHLDSDNITFGNDNPHISPLAAPDNLTYQWLRKSVLSLVGGRFGFNEAGTNERFRRSVRSAFGRLDAVPGESGPKFVLFHTLMPHDPYIFGARGQNVTFPDHSDTGHSTKLGMKYYVRQMQYINRRLLKATDAILAHSKVPPIIVIESDEGFEALPEDWGESAVRDMRVKGLTAFYLPGAGRALPRKLNTVNSFRFLFNRFFGTRYPLLKSASYAELDNPYEFKEFPVK